MLENKYVVFHDNIKVHFNNDKDMKEYLARFGKGKISVYENKLVYERTSTSVKIDRL